MTPDEIAAARAVIDAASEGPWVETRWEDSMFMAVWGITAADGQVVTYDCNCHVAEESTRRGQDDDFIAAARTGWPRALDALEAAQEGNDRLGALVEWLSEVIVDARDACQRAESIEPSGSPEWVESGIAMRTTVLREVRAILDRERTAHPSALDKATDRAEQAEAAIARVRALCDEAEADLDSKHVCGPDCHCDCLAPKDVRAAADLTRPTDGEA